MKALVLKFSKPGGLLFDTFGKTLFTLTSSKLLKEHTRFPVFEKNSGCM